MMVTSSAPKYWKKIEHYKSFATLWMSKVITKLIIGNVRKLFRDIEKKSIKLIETKSHRAFNECCLNNNLLPNYTNIYIYIYTPNSSTHVYSISKQLSNFME